MRYTKTIARAVPAASLALLVALAGCGGESSSQSDNTYVQSKSTSAVDGGFGAQEDFYYDDASDYSDDTLSEPQAAAVTETSDGANGIEGEQQAMIRRSADIMMTSRDFEQASATLSSILKKYSVVTLEDETDNDTYYGGHKSQSRDIRFRVKSEQFDEVCDLFAGEDVWEIQSSDKSSEDVTKQYSDREQHIAALQTKYDWYRRQLETVNDPALAREYAEAMFETLEEIDYLRNQNGELKTDVDYSVISVRLVADTTTSAPQEENDSVWEELKDEALALPKRMSSALAAFLLFLVKVLPSLLVIALFCLVLRVVAGPFVKRARKKAEEQREARMAAMARYPQPPTPGSPSPSDPVPPSPTGPVGGMPPVPPMPQPQAPFQPFADATAGEDASEGDFSDVQEEVSEENRLGGGNARPFGEGVPAASEEEEADAGTVTVTADGRQEDNDLGTIFADAIDGEWTPIFSSIDEPEPDTQDDADDADDAEEEAMRRKISDYIDALSFDDFDFSDEKKEEHEEALGESPAEDEPDAPADDSTAFVPDSQAPTGAPDVTGVSFAMPTDDLDEVEGFASDDVSATGTRPVRHAVPSPSQVPNPAFDVLSQNDVVEGVLSDVFGDEGTDGSTEGASGASPKSVDSFMSGLRDEAETSRKNRVAEALRRQEDAEEAQIIREDEAREVAERIAAITARDPELDLPVASFRPVGADPVPSDEGGEDDEEAQHQRWIDELIGTDDNILD